MLKKMAKVQFETKTNSVNTIFRGKKSAGTKLFNKIQHGYI